MTSKIEIQGGYATRDGGNVLFYGSTAPLHFERHADSVAVGPLRIRPWHDSEVEVDGLEYRDESSGGLWPFGMLAAAATVIPAVTTENTPADGDESGPHPDVSRRGVLGALAALAAGHNLATPASASDLESSTMAAFELTTNPQGIQLGVSNALENHLPSDQTYHVYVNGESRGDFDPSNGESFTLNPGVEGSIEVKANDAVGFIESIRSKYFAENTVEFTGVTPAGLSDDEYYSDREGEHITLNSHLLADAADSADPEDVEVTIDGDTLPHADADPSPMGYWHVQGSELRYVIGSEAPEARLFDLRIAENTGFW